MAVWNSTRSRQLRDYWRVFRIFKTLSGPNKRPIHVKKFVPLSILYSLKIRYTLELAYKHAPAIVLHTFLKGWNSLQVEVIRQAINSNRE